MHEKLSKDTYENKMSPLLIASMSAVNQNDALKGHAKEDAALELFRAGLKAHGQDHMLDVPGMEKEVRHVMQALVKVGNEAQGRIQNLLATK